MYSMPAGDQPVDTEYTISVMTTKYLPSLYGVGFVWWVCALYVAW